MTAERLPAQRNIARNAESLSDVDAAGLLTVIVQPAGDAVSVIRVIGELDMLTGPLLEDHLVSLLATRPKRLIVDLGGVSFLGSTGLSILIKTRDIAGQQGTALQLTGAGRREVALPLRITGLDCLFDIVPPDGQGDG